MPFATPGWGQVLTDLCVFSVLGREGRHGMMSRILPLSEGEAEEGRDGHRGRILVEGLRARQGTVRDPGVQGLLWEGREGGGKDGEGKRLGE